MRRLLSLTAFVPLLLTTMAVGPCDPQPLGSVDAGDPPASGDGGPGGYDSGTPGSPDSGTPRPIDSGTPGSPDSGTPRPIDSGTPGSPDSGTPRPIDSGTPSGADARPAGPVCAFDAIYTYGADGGFAPWRDRVILEPPADYRFSRTPYAQPQPAVSCMPLMPDCGTVGLFDVADIMRDIADPDVQALLAGPVDGLVGYDARPVDGSVFRFARGDGRSFLVGSPCGGTPACVPIPPGVDRLVTDLRALDRQQLANPECARMLTTP